jgi:outer membrane protein OmpA-like peptidoglycan-associated protein
MNKPRIVLIFFAFLLAVTEGRSQTTELLAKGDSYVRQKDYQSALSLYFRALRQEPASATVLYKIGYTYLQTETKGQAITFLEKAYKIDSEVDPKILYYIGVAYQSSLQYTKAKQIYEAYRKIAFKKDWDEIDYRIRQCVVSHSLVNNPIDVLIENTGPSINSVFDDFAPILSTDGNTMIFTSNRTADTVKARAHAAYEDIYISVKQDDDEWGVPKKIGKGINMGYHDAAASLSPDGKTLFLYYDLNKGDIYTSTLDEKGEWAKPVALGANINTPTFRETSATVSADGKKLYFSSSRPGGKGNLDIYMSKWDAVNGRWGKAINLGPEINTPGDEDSPFIHADTTTLYFSSDGHPGMGSSDIFRSVLKNGKWQKPENLGYPLNSIEYDGFFTISADKKTGYFATKRKYGVGGYDILQATYRFGYPGVTAMPEPIVAKTEPQPEKKPEPAVVATPGKPKPQPPAAPVKATTPEMFSVKGKVFDKGSNQPLKVKISLVYVKTKKLVAVIESNSAGDYEVKVAQAGKYVLTAESEGYLFNSLNIDVPQPVAVKNSSADFLMIKADVGSVMVLKNVFFDTGKADLKPSSILELEKIRELLVNNPKLKVQINGHTDNVGDAAANKMLSLKRALAVVNHLALNGIEFNRLGAKGFGSEKPVATNDDEKGGREFNRRTEIEIVDTKGGEGDM